ncbi:hypothetical protein LSAT2_004783 [Lamellibrachia satsuma]|nr:hypothetical protein LSAT2_004783 [Lamellibrachia satsuma]
MDTESSKTAQPNEGLRRNTTMDERWMTSYMTTAPTAIMDFGQDVVGWSAAGHVTGKRPHLGSTGELSSDEETGRVSPTSWLRSWLDNGSTKRTPTPTPTPMRPGVDASALSRNGLEPVRKMRFTSRDLNAVAPSYW